MVLKQTCGCGASISIEGPDALTSSLVRARIEAWERDHSACLPTKVEVKRV